MVITIVPIKRFSKSTPYSNNFCFLTPKVKKERHSSSHEPNHIFKNQTKYLSLISSTQLDLPHYILLFSNYIRDPYHYRDSWEKLRYSQRLKISFCRCSQLYLSFFFFSKNIQYFIGKNLWLYVKERTAIQKDCKFCRSWAST